MLVPGARLRAPARSASLSAGHARTGRLDLTEARETLDALLQRSVEAFPVTPLGL
jgi:hypothetical protein